MQPSDIILKHIGLDAKTFDAMSIDARIEILRGIAVRDPGLFGEMVRWARMEQELEDAFEL